MSPSPPPAIARTAYLGLGSNLGDRRAAIGAALDRLALGSRQPGERRLFLYATPAVGLPGAPEFLNAAARIETRLEPEALLDLCLCIEEELGRVRSGRMESRPIDLDVLLYPGVRRNGPGLIRPHPRLLERAFVLLPLSEIAPNEMIEGRTVADWAARLPASGIRKLA